MQPQASSRRGPEHPSHKAYFKSYRPDIGSVSLLVGLHLITASDAQPSRLTPLAFECWSCVHLCLEFRSAYFFDVLRRHFRLPQHCATSVPFSGHQQDPSWAVHLPHSIFPMTNMLLTPALFGLPSSGKTPYAAQVKYPMHHLPVSAMCNASPPRHRSCKLIADAFMCVRLRLPV